MQSTQVLYRAEQAMGGVLANSLGVEKHMSMGGLEVVMTGDPAQIKPIGDDRMWKPGGYTGKAKNKPRKDVEAPVDAPSVDKFVDMCRLFREEFEDVVRRWEQYCFEWGLCCRTTTFSGGDGADGRFGVDS